MPALAAAATREADVVREQLVLDVSTRGTGAAKTGMHGRWAGRQS